LWSIVFFLGQNNSDDRYLLYTPQANIARKLELLYEVETHLALPIHLELGNRLFQPEMPLASRLGITRQADLELCSSLPPFLGGNLPATHKSSPSTVPQDCKKCKNLLEIRESV
jgi:hypothetical protein